MGYKNSYYNLIEEHEGNLIVYNTKTGAVGIIPKEDADKYRKTFENPNNEIYKEQITILAEQNFLIKDEIDEFEEIKKWHEKALKFPNYIQITMLPNENCNFDCPYCFIYTHRNMVMTDTVFESVLKYQCHLVRHNLNYFQWFSLMEDHCFFASKT